MIHTACYHQGYPRPQFVRTSYTCLNGQWHFCFDDDNIGENNGWTKSIPHHTEINVPFVYQTPMSGINDQTYHKTLWYEKQHKFSIPKNDERIILTLEGCDYETKLWCNGVYVGSHIGGYTRFSFDITDFIGSDGNTTIIMKVTDDKRADRPRGKQSWLSEPFGCWYTPTSGIWKTVWVEYVNKTRLNSIKMTPIASNYHLSCRYEIENLKDDCSLKTTISFRGSVIAEQTNRLFRENGTFDIDLSNDLDSFKIHWWTPDNPQLYDVEFSLICNNKEIDNVKSYTAFRIFRTDKNKFVLNLNPIYLRMVLEQGYWRESGLTAPSEEALVKEIELIKTLGFNGARVHQKVEDERFFYYADTMGIVTFCEMPSLYEFSEDYSAKSICDEWLNVIKQHYNHPSVIAWVPINESWGVNRITFNKQEAHFTQALYHMTKALDPMRPVISNDGWEHTQSDIVTFHNYCQDADKLATFYEDLADVVNGSNKVNYSNLRLPFAPDFHYNGQPIMVDEFAGIGFRSKDDNGWGYGDSVLNKDHFVDRLSSLIATITNKQEIAGFCVTQITDVYQEINGLCDFDRIAKADIEKLRKAILQ